MFGRFVPDFGRVVAQMQFDMYHHYTVDEHSIRAIGLLSRDRARRAGRGSSALHRACSGRSRRAGRSMSRCCSTTSPRAAAATTACSAPRSRCELCPRFGLDAAETETVAWLVRWHLLMSATAFKRDLADPKTIEDFVRAGEEPRAAAAAADPDRRRHPRGRARAPGTAGSGSCCAPCSTRPRRCCGSATSRKGGSERVAARQEELADALGWKRAASRAHAPAPARQLLAGRAARVAGRQCPPDRRRRSAHRRCRAERRSPSPIPAIGRDPWSASTRPTEPGLFYRIAAAISRRRRQHHRRAHPHHARRHGARQFPGPGRARARPSTTARLRKRLVEGGRRGAGRRRRAAAAARRPLPQPRAGLRDRAGGVDRRTRRRAGHGGRGQCARPRRRCWRGWPARSTTAGHRSIRRISRLMASARSTSST